jgi:glutamate carboxypeptidase
MQAAGTLRDADIEIVLTGDEEDAGDPIEIARRDLIEAGRRADIALDFEGLSQEDGRDMGSTARRSSGSWEVRATGRTGHSSGIFGPTAGNGAIYELARIIAAFRSELPEQNLTFNVGLLAGGTTAALDEAKIRATATGKTNIIPEIAIARGDIRTLSREQNDRVMAKMREIVSRHLPGAGAAISFDPGGYPPMAPTAGNRALLDRLNAVNRDLGPWRNAGPRPAEARRRRYRLRRRNGGRSCRSRHGGREGSRAGRIHLSRQPRPPGQARRHPDDAPQPGEAPIAVGPLQLRTGASGSSR